MTQATQAAAVQMPEDLKIKLAELQESILSAHPRLPILLRDIHKQLKEDASIVTILTDEEIEIVVSGLKKQTTTEITQAAIKARIPKGKSITLADL